MNIIYIFINFFLTATVAVVLFQIIPTALSSDDWLKFGGGVGLMLIGAAFVWARCVEIYNDIRKGEK